MKSFTYVIQDPLGIHARPAGLPGQGRQGVCRHGDHHYQGRQDREGHSADEADGPGRQDRRHRHRGRRRRPLRAPPSPAMEQFFKTICKHSVPPAVPPGRRAFWFSRKGELVHEDFTGPGRVPKALKRAFSASITGSVLRWSSRWPGTGGGGAGLGWRPPESQAMEQLEDMAEKARAQAGDDAATLFETHAMFLEDEDFTGAMDEQLEEGYTAEYAAQQARGAVRRHAGRYGRLLHAGPGGRCAGRGRPAGETSSPAWPKGHSLGCSGHSGRRRPGPLRDHPAGQEQNPGHRHRGRLRQQPHRHSGPHHGHSRRVRPGRRPQRGSGRPGGLHRGRDRPAGL